jgi:hypothetical protein
MDKELSVENIIATLSSIRWRIVEYDKNMLHYPDDYKEQLIKVDTAAIDKAISVLRSQE